MMAEGKVFVVIDVLRATTTIIEALSNGCTDVIPVVTVDEAFDRDLLEMARSCEHGRELIRLGLEEDLAFCVQTNVSSSVPVFKKGSITLDWIDRGPFRR
jgi:phosphosulfolactate phosphohydrolase-like enzyme